MPCFLYRNACFSIVFGLFQRRFPHNNGFKQRRTWRFEALGAAPEAADRQARGSSEGRQRGVRPPYQRSRRGPRELRRGAGLRLLGGESAASAAFDTDFLDGEDVKRLSKVLKKHVVRPFQELSEASE